MESLKEYLTGEAAKVQSERSLAIQTRDEWVKTVGRLLAMIRVWLNEADPGNLLTYKSGNIQLRERGIGSYEAPCLIVEFGVREISIKPAARFVAGPVSYPGSIQIARAFGRVDMSNGLEKFMLFRSDKTDEDRWIIIEEEGYRSHQLDRSSFELAFKSLLS
jgi:hypothetical protein